jgi:hypothetical protein
VIKSHAPVLIGLEAKEEAGIYPTKLYIERKEKKGGTMRRHKRIENKEKKMRRRTG